MNPRKNSEPNTWPVIECEVTDEFLGTFDYDCTPTLTEEQLKWQMVECETFGVTFVDQPQLSHERVSILPQKSDSSAS